MRHLELLQCHSKERMQHPSCHLSKKVLQNTEMSMDWNKFKEFLRNLGVEWESDAQIPKTIPAEWESDAQGLHRTAEEPLITVLQRSHDHEALYRVDWLQTGPELLVLLPTQQATLKFHFYRVTLSTTYPLGDALTRLIHYQGSAGFEQRRDVAEWHLLHATVETMKALFWTGQETSQFPPEIIVQKIG
jgi:hypothetical protein